MKPSQAIKKQTVLFLLSLLTLTSLSAQRISSFGPPPPPELQLSGTIEGYHSNPNRITIKNGRMIPESRLEIKQNVNAGNEDTPGRLLHPTEANDCYFGQKPSTWILDRDGDGYPGDIKISCNRQSGYIMHNPEENCSRIPEYRDIGGGLSMPTGRYITSCPTVEVDFSFDCNDNELI